jgi:hypothetical protein
MGIKQKGKTKTGAGKNERKNKKTLKEYKPAYIIGHENKTNGDCERIFIYTREGGENKNDLSVPSQPDDKGACNKLQAFGMTEDS